MKVLLPLADGVEELEAVTIVDLLRRGGVEVCIAATGDKTLVRGSRDVTILADALWEESDLSTFDAMVLPGGAGGTQALVSDPRILQALKEFDRSGKWIGAICAAPMVLAAAGVLKGHKATCYPSCEGPLGNSYVPEMDVVVDGRLITSQGPGTAIPFALALLKFFVGEETAESVRAGLLYRLV